MWAVNWSVLSKPFPQKQEQNNATERNFSYHYDGQALCQYKRDNPQLSQKDLIKWIEDNHRIKVSQTTIFTTLQWSAEILAKFDNETNLNAKH
jgi:hypothetical protein